MARRKVSTTVYLTVEQHAALSALHSVTKVPVAEFIRQGVDFVLAKNEVPGPWLPPAEARKP